MTRKRLIEVEMVTGSRKFRVLE